MKYRTIVADPPWDTKAGSLGGREGFLGARGPTRDLAYPTMSVDEIAALRVADLADSDADLYLWTINAYVEDAYRVARAWGFRPSTMLVWAKNIMGGGLGGKFGISTEFILYSYRGSQARNGRHAGTWWNWKRPYDERGKPRHSAKPDAFLDIVERVSPGPYLELFARRQRLGWDTYGDQAFCHVDLGSVSDG